MSKRLTPDKPEEKKMNKRDLLTNYRSILFMLQMKNKMGQLEKTHQIKQLKREIARLLTKSKVNEENQTAQEKEK